MCVFSDEERVDVLINNAAVMRCPPGKTEDGFDMQFGVNYLGETVALKESKFDTATIHSTQMTLI